MVANGKVEFILHAFLPRYKDPAGWTASFGVTINPPKMKRGIRRIIVHEKYKYPSHDYDISVAELSSPVPYTNAVHRICLPDASYEFHPGDEMFVTGFGARQNDGENLRGKSNHSNLSLYSKTCKERNVIMPKYVSELVILTWAKSSPVCELSHLADT